MAGANRLDQTDLFSKRLADLAAAKGIKPQELGEISKQLNALTDEATDKLLGANPSAFYEKYAQSVGKTAASLTDAEKRAAVFDEVIRKGAIHTGEAERRAATYSGTIDKMSSSWDNFISRLGQKWSPQVSMALKFLWASTTGSPEFFMEGPSPGERQAEVNRKFAESIPTLKAQNQAYLDAKRDPKSSFQNYAISRLQLSKDIFAPDNFSGVSIADQKMKFDEANKGKFLLYGQDADARKQLIDQAIKDATGTSDELVKSFKDIASKRPSLAVLLFEQERFKANAFRLKDYKVKDEVAEALGDAINDVVAK